MKATSLKKYVEDIEPSGFACYWTPSGKWHRAHGDGKSSTGGKFWTETMLGSSGDYKVRVKQGKSLALGPFTIPGSDEPTSEKVVEELQSRV